MRHIKRFPIRYKEGSVLDSIQVRHLKGEVTDLKVPVGAQFSVPHSFDKLIVTERFDTLIMDRVFVRYQNQKTWTPVYTKHYDLDSAHVIMYPTGIGSVISDLSGKHRRIVPMRRILTECTVEECLAKDENIGFILRPPTGLILLVDDEATLLADPDDVDLLEGYPWKMVRPNPYELQRIRSREREYHWRAANSLYDRWIEKGIYSSEDVSSHPVNIELQCLEDPTFGSKYQELALDPTTDMCSKESEVDLGWIQKMVKAGIPSPSRMDASNLAKTYTPVTRFSSEILQLCVWVHGLRFHECVLKYTLPKRTPKRCAGCFVYKDWTMRQQTNISQSEQMELIMGADQIFGQWDSDTVNAVTVVKLASDEMYLTVHRVDGTSSGFFIDLTVSTLLSQGLACL